MNLLIWYYQRPFGWLQKANYPDLLELRGPMKRFELQASIHHFIIEGNTFFFSDYDYLTKIPAKSYMTDWWSFDLAYESEARLINLLRGLGWSTVTIDADLYPYWRRGKITAGHIIQAHRDHWNNILAERAANEP